MNAFLQEIKKKVLVFDGSKGTMLQRVGLTGEECPEIWNLEHPKEVRELYCSYIAAGSDVIQTNTFGANSAILEKFNFRDKVTEINTVSVKLAKESAGESVFVAASIGPTGKLIEPLGDLTFEEAYNIFKEQVIAITKAGADIVNFETISDLYEMKAAILAARENSPLPIIASMTFEPNGFTLMGNTPAACALVCQSLGADLIGANCSSGPQNLLGIIKQMSSYSSLPLSVKANAGLPQFSGDVIVYNETPEKFKTSVVDFVQNGVRLIGGCCGTTPEHISAIKEELKNSTLEHINKPQTAPGSFICSSSKLINLRDIEKLNTGCLIDNNNLEFFKHKVDENAMDIVTDRVLALASEGFDSLYLNLDIIGKPELLFHVTKTVQSYSKLPIIFQSSSASHLESALRVYNGKAGVIIGNISDNTFELIISAKKYGSTIVEKSLVF